MTNSHSIGAPSLASQRHLFDIPDEVAFLNCAYISPLPKTSLMADEQGVRRKSRPWTVAPADFFTSSETDRKMFADFINAQDDDIAFTEGVSYCMQQSS